MCEDERDSGDMLRRSAATVVAGALLVAGPLVETTLASAVPVERAVGSTTRISVASDGRQANHNSNTPAISADGRFVAFASKATNLAPGDTNDTSDVFVRDRRRGTTQLVSVPFDGGASDRPSLEPTISADGRFVAFLSRSSHLVPGDTNHGPDVFVRDLQTQTTERVSLSDDGSQVAGSARAPRISGDGRFVLFSAVGQLDPDGSDEPFSTYVRDRVAGTTQWVCDDEAFAISRHGRFVGFNSNLALVPADSDHDPDTYINDLRNGTNRLVPTPKGASSMSDNGRYIAYPAFGRGHAKRIQLYVLDLRTNRTVMASVNASGVPGNGDSSGPILSRDGHYLAFSSQATNLVARSTRPGLVYGHDLRTGVTRPLSVNSSGASTNRPAKHPGQPPIAVSRTGQFVTFTSIATNLVPHDTNRRTDVFVRQSFRH
jgi:Tol biopolymer transport system component